MRILVTGATGYIGGRLVPRLLERGHTVRVLVRDERRMKSRSWAQDVEIHVGDLLDRESLEGAFDGIDLSYYLVHSMVSEGSKFEERDRQAAGNFTGSAGNARIIYLGGLLPKGKKRSKHLSSRAEVGSILRERTRALELRAGPIIGSGSASFEMVRYLTERLPIMITPKWIDNLVQPISIRDVLSYLVSAADSDEEGVIEIGAEALSFREMMERYAEIRDLHRIIIPVPVLAPKLAGRWVGAVTPIPNRVGVPLIEGIVDSVVADTRRAREVFPSIEPISYRDAVKRALASLEVGDVETSWSGALLDGATYELEDREGMMVEIRSLPVAAPPEQTYRAFSTLGGEKGWLAWKWAWEARGLLDSIFGGPGLSRGRRHPVEIAVGESVDFWRVENVELNRSIRLRAEMKVPGRAWLQWETFGEEGASRLVQTALFAPRGLFGFLYWYGLYPIHQKIFSDMARAVARDAEKAQAEVGRGRPTSH